jgi:hypothetical protein
MELPLCGGYFVAMHTDEDLGAKAMSAIVNQVQDLIEMATYETQTDVAATLAHWTASIVAGEIRDATLSVFATTDPETGDVVERIIKPTDLRIVVTLPSGSTLERLTTLRPSANPYLVSLRPA